MFAVVRWAKGGSTSTVFNFKRDVKQAEKENPKQENIQEDKTLLGKNTMKKDVFISNKAKHIFVCGTTGSGKTVALSNFIASGNEHDYPMLIIDGKGDVGRDTLLDITTKMSANRKVYVVDLNNPQTSDRYNPFQNTGADIIKDMLINMSNWTEEHYKFNTERYIQRLANLLELSDIKVSLATLTKYIPVDAFKKLSKDLETKKLISKEEHTANLALAKASGEIAEGAAARFATIKESRLGQIFHEDGIDIYTALKENAIILFILNPLLYPEMSPLIGKLIIIDSKKAISLFYQNERKKRIFYLLDEINVYASTGMLDLVNKSRSANITCVLATQSLSDLAMAHSEAFKEQILENCNNYILLRQNCSANAEYWANMFGTKQTLSATYQIKGSDDSVESTELGSLRRTREFIYHPDEIKKLSMGNAIYMSRDTNFHTKVNIHKPF